MSARHPIIAVTGSSGAGTSTTSLAFRKIFQQLNIRAAEVEGDSFHRYSRPEMDVAIRKARDLGGISVILGPRPMTSLCWNRPLPNMPARVPVAHVNIYIPMMKQCPGNSSPVPSPPGNLYRRIRMSCSMKDYTAVLLPDNTTLLTKLI